MIFGPSAGAPPATPFCAWRVAWPVARRAARALVFWGGCALPYARACVRESPSGLGGEGPEPRTLRRRPALSPESSEKSGASAGTSERKSVQADARVSGNGSECPSCPVCQECAPVYIRNKGPCEAADVVLVSVVVLVTALLIALLLTSLLRHRRRHTRSPDSNDPAAADSTAPAANASANPRRRRRFSALFRRSISSIWEENRSSGDWRRRHGHGSRERRGPAGDKPTDIDSTQSRGNVKWTSSSFDEGGSSRAPTVDTVRSSDNQADESSSLELTPSSSLLSNARQPAITYSPVSASGRGGRAPPSAPPPLSTPPGRLSIMRASSAGINSGPFENRGLRADSLPTVPGARTPVRAVRVDEGKTPTDTTRQSSSRQATPNLAAIPLYDAAPAGRSRTHHLATVAASTSAPGGPQTSSATFADAGALPSTSIPISVRDPVPVSIPTATTVLPVTVTVAATAISSHDQRKPSEPSA